MTDGLLYKKDTDFVRDNMLINYCLGDDESLLIESFVRNNGICLRFDVGRFYFFMTGTHKKFVTGYTPMTFSEGVDSALAIYDLMLETLRQNGFDGNAFLVKIDNSKQVGVLFSPRADAACPADEMAQKMLDAYTHAKDPYSVSGEDCTSTSFVGPFSGYDQIHKAFVKIFGARPRVHAIRPPLSAMCASWCTCSASERARRRFGRRNTLSMRSSRRRIRWRILTRCMPRRRISAR